MNIRHIILRLLILAAIPAHADVISTGIPQKINQDWLFQPGDPEGNPAVS